MRVLEIGCGASPGPFIEGATEHIVLDKDPQELVKAAAVVRREKLTQRLGDAACLEDPDDSFDLVLARNVLGDPSLGMSRSTAEMSDVLKMQCLRDGDMSAYREIVDEVHGAVNRLKDDIVTEAVRVLRPGGTFAVVEEYTPQVALNYITDAVSEERIRRLDRAEPEMVLPTNYFNHHRRYGRLDVWTATK